MVVWALVLDRPAVGIGVGVEPAAVCGDLVTTAVGVGAAVWAQAASGPMIAIRARPRSMERRLTGKAMISSLCSRDSLARNLPRSPGRGNGQRATFVP